jgi:type IV secretion system protein VirD4
MGMSPPVRDGGSDHLDSAVLTVVVVAVIAASWAWLTAELVGWSQTGRWPRVTAGAVLAAWHRLPAHVSDPSQAWRGPALSGVRSAGPWTFYGWAALLAVVGVIPWLFLIRRGPLVSASGQRTGGARWARRRDLAPVRIARRARRQPVSARLLIGRTGRKGTLVATEARHSVLVIGPTQSGKTSGLAIPALLEWPGPVVATSVKDDLARTTLTWRRHTGPCFVFDPTCGSGLGPLSRWSPLSTCVTWSDAQKAASSLVEATPGRRGMADAAFWYTTATKHLAPLLLAAARSGLGMADVVRWTDSEEYDEPIRVLEVWGENDAARALTACAGREERIRSSVATTLETVLAPFEDPTVAASTAASDFDVAAVLADRGTIYLCGPSHEQNRVQGLFAALVSAVVATTIARAAATGRTLDPPLLLVLDEAANIAPVRDLDTLASTAAGLGIQLVTVCQDLAQLGARYDAARARTIANNHRAKLLLSGVSDLGTLDLISGLAGEQAVREESSTRDLRDGRRTRSTTTVMRRLAPTDELRRVPPGEGVLVYGHLPPVRIRLRPWFSDRRLKRRALAG